MNLALQILVSTYALFTLIMLVVRFERGLLLLIPVVPLATYTYRTPVMGLNLNNLLIYVAFSMGLLRRIGRQGSLPPATLPLLTFFGLTLISWLVGYLNYRNDAYAYETLRWFVNIERWVLYTLLYFAYYFGWSDKIPERTGFHWMFAGVLIAAVYNVYEMIFSSAYLAYSGRAGGLFGQANSNGIFLASYGFLPLALAGTVRGGRRVLYAGAFLLCTWGVIVSGSRAALVCLVAAGLVFAFYRSKRAFLWLVLGLAISVPVGSVLLPKSILTHYESTFQGSDYEGVAGNFEASAANRVVQNEAGVKLFLDSPILGHGLGGFYYRSPKYLPPGSPDVTRSAHSTFLAFAVEGGILSLGALFWLLGTLALNGKRLYESGAPEEERFYGLFLLVCMVAKIIANFFNTEFITGDVSSFLWITAALVSRVYAKVPMQSFATKPIPSPWRPRARPGVQPPVAHG